METTPVITKETKNKISVDYEGKLSFKERMIRKLKTSNTWIVAGINVLRFILMLGISFVILYPFFSKIAGSFMTKEDVVDATILLIPKNFTLEQYKWIIVENRYFEAFFNTLFLSLACALIQTFVACLVGYGLSKFKFKGNKLVMIAVVITMAIPSNTLMLSMMRHFTFFDIGNVMALGNQGILTTLFGKIELIDTFWPFIILSVSGLAFKNGLYIYMMRQFFKGVPDELEESAYVDGSGTFRTFIQIIIPLSVPMMITIFLFAFSWQWTDETYWSTFMPGWSENVPWMMPNVARQIPDHLNITFAGQALYENVIHNTAGMMIIAPLIIMYLFCQRYLVQGIERSGIVG